MNLDIEALKESLKAFMEHASKSEGDRLIESVTNNPDFGENFAQELEEIRTKK